MYVFTTRADTIMGVTFCAVAPEHPLADAGREGQRRAGRLHREVPRGRHHRGRAGAARQGRPAHRLDGDAPADRRGRAAVGRQLRADELRRRRGDGRAGARRARFRVRQQVRHRDQAGHRCRRPRLQHHHLGRLVRRQAASAAASIRAATTAWASRPRSMPSPPTWPPRAWARRRPPGGCATGASAASATGARRSRSSTAPSMARCRCPRRTCRWCCPRT